MIDLSLYGWAPGNYLNGPCRECGDELWCGAKRSRNCEPCAVKRYKEHTEKKPMNLNQYQELTGLTALPSIKGNVLYYGLGLASEAGEVAGKLKKQMRDGDEGPSDEDVLKEVGGCLWYLSEICNTLGASLEEVMQQNADILVSRKQRGVLGGSGDNR